MHVPNNAIPVYIDPLYDYLQGDTKEETLFLRATATNMSKFGKLPWSLEKKYHSMIRQLINEGIDHTHPDFPKTEKQAEVTLKKYSSDDNTKTIYERAIRAPQTMSASQTQTRKKQQKVVAKKHGYTIPMVNAFYKAKGKGLQNLKAMELVHYMRMCNV